MSESILDKLYTYIDDRKNSDEKPEFKPNEFNEDEKYKSLNVSSTVETIKKNSGTQISNENKIICSNIIKSFLGLNDEKFLACLEKIREWGFETCMEQFIMDYYLYMKQDNNLRQYIIMHLKTILNVLKDQLEGELIKKISTFNFLNSKDDLEIQTLKNNLKNKQQLLADVKAQNFNEDSPISEKEKEKLEVSEKNDLRTEILNNLRTNNSKLEEML